MRYFIAGFIFWTACTALQHLTAVHDQLACLSENPEFFSGVFAMTVVKQQSRLHA